MFPVILIISHLVSGLHCVKHIGQANRLPCPAPTQEGTLAVCLYKRDLVRAYPLGVGMHCSVAM